MNDHRLKAWSELMLFTVKGSHGCFLLFVIVNEGLESFPVVAKHQNSLLLT